MKQAPMLERPVWQRTDSGLWPTSIKELGLSDQKATESCQRPGKWAWKWIFNKPSRKMIRAPAVDCSSVRDAEAENPAKLYLDSWPTESVWDMVVLSQ